MAAITAFVRQRSVPAYAVLTFLISWGGVLLAVAPVGFFGSVTAAAFPLALLANEAGPLLAGPIMAGLVYGRTGLREFAARLLQWRVGIRWYAVALLAAPLLVTPTLAALSLFSSAFLPAIVTSDDRAGLLLTGLMVTLLGGLFEEPGWTGFATPALRRRYGVLATGAIIGFLWGAWHTLLTFWASGDAAGAFSLASFLPPMLFYVGVLPPFRVLMVRVYDHTESLPIAMLMHGVLSGVTTFVLAPGVSGASLALYYIVLTAVVWAVVAVVVAISHGQQARPPLGMRPV